jgi:hypothetical protein
MPTYTLTHLSDDALLRRLSLLVARDRAITAALLAHIAEVDARRLYLPAGYPSMHAYCVDELHLSEDAAYKRIQVARAARRFPALFTALAEGRLHLAGACLLAPHLNSENADELLAAAACQRKSGIEEMLARRLARQEVADMVLPVPALAPPLRTRLAPGQADAPVPDPRRELAPGQVQAAAGGASPTAVTPPAPERFLLQVTISKGTRDKLRYAQALLSHSIPSGEVALVLDRALDALIGRLEKRKFAATERPRPRSGGPARAQGQADARARASARRGGGSTGRSVPAHVRRAVWQRDRGQCTFMGERGHRCRARTFLEFDHVEPVARGGLATVEGMRLRCRAHNQYEAERTFGAEFMSRKRDAARHAAGGRRAGAATSTATGAGGEAGGEGAETRARARAGHGETDPDTST